MKTLIWVGILGFAGGAAAEGKVAAVCYKNAAKFAEEQATGGYDRDGFWAYECSVAENKKAVICDVGASKGGGDATDTYRVVMNRSCSKAFRVELTGEE